MGDPLNIEVISRLERLEARMRVVESRPTAEPAGPPPDKSSDSAEIEALIREHTQELENLRSRLDMTEEKIAQSAESGRELIVAGADLPAKVDEEFEIRIDARVENMRAEIETDLARLNRRTVTAIEHGVDDRIATRTLPLERAVRSQAKAIDDLRERMNLLESHLQRLVGTVERLLDRPPQPAATPAVSAEQPTFRTYLDHAVNNDPIPPPPSVDPLFRPRIIKEDENRSASAPRRPLSPLR